ncbi:MAG: GH1 family beta-glucosidase [Ilumatobacteraceae bacterium]|nr:GH1 family beta-glucosidase [Ilumatobacteraceae bacterium]
MGSESTTTTRTDSDATSPGAFPTGFLWGAATAAYQIEGAAAEGGRGPSIWDDFSHTPGLTRNGDTGDVACDHYHRWRTDLDLAADIGITAYRFSVSWARLQPAGDGPLNPEGVRFYRDLLEGLHERNIRPVATLYHWDLPSPLEAAGGWPARDTAERFAEYARLTVDALGDLATDWVTLNEPWCSSFLGYHSGAHAPGRRDLGDAVRAAHHLNLAHGLAVRAIREGRHGGVALGISNLITDVVPAGDHPDDVAAARRVDANANQTFLTPVYGGEYSSDVHDLYDRHGLSTAIQPGDLGIISAPCDFAGVNHYHRHVVAADAGDPHLGAVITDAEPAPTALGWSFLPESLRCVLRRVATHTDLPLHVTENGAAYDDQVDADGRVDDRDRVEYLDAYTGAVAQAIADGIDVRGYFAWSLLDNFEWAEGYDRRFGLVYVDYATQQRIPKSSAHWYRAHIAGHSASP